MRPLLTLLLTLLLTVNMAYAEGEPSGKFDYYLLSLSWSPNWCEREGDARGSEQCGNGAGFGWIMHGLWPQFEKGWPSYCRSQFWGPSRAETRAMADVMGSSGQAWHQWKKHGRCSGLSAQDYFRLSRLAYEGVTRPPVLRKLTETVWLPASVIEEAFLEANPNLIPDMITITCKGNAIQEARLCLTRNLEPRICGADVIRDCSLETARFDPIR